MNQKSNKFLYICCLDFVFSNIGIYLLFVFRDLLFITWFFNSNFFNMWHVTIEKRLIHETTIPK